MNIKNFFIKPKKYYWYDVNKKYFYIPGEKNILRFNVLEALVLIGSIRLLHMDKKTLFKKIEWPNYITYADIKQFVQAWENGLLDPTIEWICENNIECEYEDKKDYLYNI